MVVTLVAVGLVWFYPREHSSKVPSEKRTGTTGQAKFVQPKPEVASGNDSVLKQKPTFKYTDARLGYGMEARLAKELKLNDQEVDQAMSIISSTRQRVCELMADQATVIEASNTTIKFKIQLSAEQATELEQKTLGDLYKIIGDNRWSLFNDDMDSDVRSQMFDFGRDPHTFTFTGAEMKLTDSREISNPTNPPLSIAVAPAINITMEVDHGNGNIFKRYSHFADASFKDEFGKIATMVSDLAKEPNNSAQ